MAFFYALMLFHTEGPQFQSIVTSAIIVGPEKQYFVQIIFYYLYFIIISLFLLRLTCNTEKELKSLNPIGFLTFKQQNLELRPHFSPHVPSKSGSIN